MMILLATMVIGQKPEKPAITFNAVQYLHRFTKDNLHEYTPKAQSDLKKWTDMFTINDYPKVKTGEDLAQSANSVLEAYKDQKAMVVRTDSVPRTEKKEAEHLIVVMFVRSEFIETAFARFVIANDKGCSLVYSHRIYGAKAGDPMSKWLGSNGQKVENALMKLSVPKH